MMHEGKGGHGSGGGGRGRGDRGGRNAPANIDTWVFSKRSAYGGPPRPTPYFVGPIVGTVTGTTARVLVELAGSNSVTMVAYMDGEEVCTVTQDLRIRTPTIFKLNGFAPGKRIRVSVKVGQAGQEREARFTTPSDKTDWKIATVSCNCHSLMENLGLWQKLAKVVGDVDCVLHMGDQVYADMDIMARNSDRKFNSAWKHSNRMIEDIPVEEWDSYRNKILEQYRKVYRLTWNYPPLAQVLASAANYMICDDHEVVDDLGDAKEHTDPNSREFFVIKLAYQVYLEYQKQLFCDVDVLDMSNKVYYGHKLSPKIGIFMLDNRIERSLHRSQGTDEQWEHKTMLGPQQWNDIPNIFRHDFRDCETVLFVSPTPLVFLSQGATVLASKVNDDAMGLWGHKKFQREQAALCNLLSNWQNAKPNRSIVALGGDVHVGGFTDSNHEGHEAPIHQMTSSAIGNLPEVHMDRTKEAIMVKAMSLDEHNFKFKTKHHKWIFGPNFGMVDIAVDKGEQRPNITMTLVPHQGAPILRNLSFGDESVDVGNVELHETAARAHATANAMK